MEPVALAFGLGYRRVGDVLPGSFIRAGSPPSDPEAPRFQKDQQTVTLTASRFIILVEQGLGSSSLEAFLNVPLPQYLAELDKDLAEAKKLEGFRKSLLTIALDEEMEAYRADREKDGEINALKAWSQKLQVK